MIEVLFGHGERLDALQMSLRAVIVFALAVLMIRMSGRRSFGQHRSFDACVTVLLGAVLSRAVVGASPFWATVAAGFVIAAMHRGVSIACVRWPRFELLVSGDKREIVRHGLLDEREMRKGLVTRRDLDEAVRKKTGDEASPLAAAILERDGVITVRVADPP